MLFQGTVLHTLSGQQVLKLDTDHDVSTQSSALHAGLVQIFTNFGKTKESLSGPVAIVAVGAEVARSDYSGLFQYAAIVNLNLAVVNTLPLPVRTFESYAIALAA